MQKFDYIIVGTSEAVSFGDLLIVKRLNDGWTIEKTVPVTSAVHYILSKEEPKSVKEGEDL
jgi:hypothetical protein